MKSQCASSFLTNAKPMQRIAPSARFTGQPAVLPSRVAHAPARSTSALRSLSMHNVDSVSADSLQMLVSAGWRRHFDSWNQHVGSRKQDTQEASAQLADELATGPVQYLYDGHCSMCRGLVALLQRHDAHGRIEYVDIQDASYSAEGHAHIEQQDALETIHVITADGSVIMGTAALRSLFDIVGLGWAAQLSESPLVSQFVDWSYDFLSTHRISLGHAFDVIAASKKMNLSKAGVESCHDLDACEVEW